MAQEKGGETCVINTDKRYVRYDQWAATFTDSDAAREHFLSAEARPQRQTPWTYSSRMPLPAHCNAPPRRYRTQRQSSLDCRCCELPGRTVRSGSSGVSTGDPPDEQRGNCALDRPVSERNRSAIPFRPAKRFSPPNAAECLAYVLRSEIVIRDRDRRRRRPIETAIRSKPTPGKRRQQSTHNVAGRAGTHHETVSNRVGLRRHYHTR
jgi:hypothetical protein